MRIEGLVAIRHARLDSNVHQSASQLRFRVYGASIAYGHDLNTATPIHSGESCCFVWDNRAVSGCRTCLKENKLVCNRLEKYNQQKKSGIYAGYCELTGGGLTAGCSWARERQLIVQPWILIRVPQTSIPNILGYRDKIPQSGSYVRPCMSLFSLVHGQGTRRDQANKHTSTLRH